MTPTALAKEKAKPNILFLFTDQHQADCMSLLGHPDVRTPNLDKLAESGTLFRRAYCQDAVCMPSRMSMMTGLYPRRIGVLDNGDRPAVVNQVDSLASVLQRNGYHTAAFGKRHLFGGGDKGWDITRSHIKHESPGNSYWEWVEKAGFIESFQKDWDAEFGKKYPFAQLATRVSELPEGKTMEAFTAQQTIKLIREQKSADQPFFCWASFYRPHQPYTPLPRYLAMYDYSKWGKGTRHGSAIAKPANFSQPADTLPPNLAKWRAGKNRVWRLDKAFEDEQLFRFYIASYYALLTEIDDHIGAILKALEEEGLRENTIIVYSSDHGDFAGRHGMVEKCATGHNVYEDTLRVPLIFSLPERIQKGVKRDDLVELVDIYPTLLQLAEIDHSAVKHGCDGQSLAPILLQNKSLDRPFVVSENWSQATIITDRYKLGKWLDPTDCKRNRDFRAYGDMLFDLDNDPHEMKNLFKYPEYASVIKSLEAHYEQFTRRIPATGKDELIQKENIKKRRPGNKE